MGLFRSLFDKMFKCSFYLRDLDIINMEIETGELLRTSATGLNKLYTATVRFDDQEIPCTYYDSLLDGQKIAAVGYTSSEELQLKYQKVFLDYFFAHMHDCDDILCRYNFRRKVLSFFTTIFAIITAIYLIFSLYMVTSMGVSIAPYAGTFIGLICTTLLLEIFNVDLRYRHSFIFNSKEETDDGR